MLTINVAILRFTARRAKKKIKEEVIEKNNEDAEITAGNEDAETEVLNTSCELFFIINSVSIEQSSPLYR